jgi:dipeptidase E
MKLLLTSGGFFNDAQVSALSDLLGKPFAECKAVFIPTAANAERGDKSWLVKDVSTVGGFGWQEFEILDVAAVSSLPKESWWPVLEQADAIIVGGGNTFYLSYWFEKSGLFAALLELLKNKVYVGISAGSMVVGDSLRTSSMDGVTLVDGDYNEVGPAGQSLAKTAQLVPFVLRPHMHSPHFSITEDAVKKLAAQLNVPLYAIDDNTAIKVVDGKTTIISKGKWKLYGKA